MLSVSGGEKSAIEGKKPQISSFCKGLPQSFWQLKASTLIGDCRIYPMLDEKKSFSFWARMFSVLDF